MAQREYRINLQNTMFPMLSEQMGRSVIGVTKEELYDTDMRPKVYYAHNVMPSSYGLDSVGFQEVIPPVLYITTEFIEIREVYGTLKSRMHLAWTAAGDVYALISNTEAWIKVTTDDTVIPPTGGDITIGVVGGISYIFYAHIAMYSYDEELNTLVEVAIFGLELSEVIGITASSGYLIAVTEQAIAWSSTIDPRDFEPSQVTGAGGGNVAGISGAIKFAIPNALGVIIYSETNAVAATYTGNARYPFKLREVDNSKGGLSLDLVAYEANSASQFVYSKAGLQAVTSQKADNILPDVTDFLAGKRFEDFDALTGIHTVTDLTTTMKKKVKFIASRYLVISYGIDTFTHALIYDSALEKLGKVKIEHADCLEYVGSQVEVSRESLAFMLADGSIQLLDFATKAESLGVCLLGKIQYTLTRMIQLLEVTSENIEEESVCAVSALSSLDGKTTTKIDGYEAYKEDNIRKHNFHVTAVNHSILYEGKFNLISVLVTYAVGGKR